jgi:hypothetical protein
MIAICIVSFRVELLPINFVFFLPNMSAPSVALAVPLVAFAIPAKVAFSLRYANKVELVSLVGN